MPPSLGMHSSSRFLRQVSSTPTGSQNALRSTLATHPRTTFHSAEVGRGGVSGCKGPFETAWQNMRGDLWKASRIHPVSMSGSVTDCHWNSRHGELGETRDGTGPAPAPHTKSAKFARNAQFCLDSSRASLFHGVSHRFLHATHPLPESRVHDSPLPSIGAAPSPGQRCPAVEPDRVHPPHWRPSPHIDVVRTYESELYRQ